MSLTTPVADGTKIAGVTNAADEEVQSARLVMGTTGDTVVDAAHPLPVTDTALQGFVDGLETLIGSTNAALATIGGYTDGVEALITAGNALLTTLGTNTDGIEGLLTGLQGYVDTLETLGATTNSLLTAVGSNTDGIETLLTALNGYVDGLETLVGATNTALGLLNGYNDNVETLITATNSALTTLQGYVDGLEAATVPPYQATPTVSFTRPADTNAYTAGDAIANSTSVPQANGFLLTGMARISGGSGILTDLIVIASDTAALAGEIWLYDSAVTAQNDNAAMSVTDADQIKLVGKVPFVLVPETNNAVAHVQNLSIGYTCNGSADLRFLMKATGGTLTPASGTTYTVRAKGIGSN